MYFPYVLADLDALAISLSIYLSLSLCSIKQIASLLTPHLISHLLRRTLFLRSNLSLINKKVKVSKRLRS